MYELMPEVNQCTSFYLGHFIGFSGICKCSADLSLELRMVYNLTDHPLRLELCVYVLKTSFLCVPHHSRSVGETIVGRYGGILYHCLVLSFVLEFYRVAFTGDDSNLEVIHIKNLSVNPEKYSFLLKHSNKIHNSLCQTLTMPINPYYSQNVTEHNFI